MTKKHFQAVLSKNDLAYRIGELYGEGKLTNGEVSFLNSCLTDIQDFIGEANQPSYQDSFKRGRDDGVRNAQVTV